MASNLAAYTYKPEVHQQRLEKQKKCLCALAGVGITAGIVLVIGIALAGHFYAANLGFHNFINHTVAHITNHMTVGEGLLCVALPLFIGTWAVRLMIYLYKRFKNTDRCRLPLPFRKNYLSRRVKETIGLNHKQVIGGAIGAIGLAALAVGLYFFFQHVSSAHDFVHDTVIPGLNRNITIWQGVAYIGGGAAAATLATHLVLTFIEKKRERAYVRDVERLHMYDTDRDATFFDS